MAIDTTSIATITSGIVSQMEQSLNTTFSLLAKSFIRVLAKSVASVFIMLTHYSNFIFLQQYVSTCSSENLKILGFTINPLAFWGDLIGVASRGEGERAELTVTVTVSQTTGTLDAGSQLISATNGYTYITSQSYTITSPSMEISVRAANDESGNNGVGASGNLDDGDELSFVNPPAVISKTAYVSGTTTTGADQEEISVYRQRIITAFKRRKQGGAYIDYKSWGEEVDGISNVYPYTGDPGEVDIYSEATEESSGSEDGIPTPTQLTEVYDSIELDENGKASRRPAGVFVNSYAITRTGFSVEVLTLSVDNETDVKEDIETAVNDFFVDAEPYITGLSVPPRKDQISTIDVESVVNDIVKANSGTFSGVNLYEFDTMAPVTTYQLGIGEKSKLSEISFT